MTKNKVLDVVAWLCVESRRVLCARTRGNTVFYLPGGKRKRGESDWEAIAREVTEEISVELVEETLREAVLIEEEAHGFTTPTRVNMKCFWAEYEGKIAPSAEIDAIAWFAMADISKCAPANQRVLEYLYEQGLID